MVISTLWFDTGYRDEGKLKEKTVFDYKDFAIWFITNYKHIHIVNIKIKNAEQGD